MGKYISINLYKLGNDANINYIKVAEPVRGQPQSSFKIIRISVNFRLII